MWRWKWRTWCESIKMARHKKHVLWKWKKTKKTREKSVRNWDMISWLWACVHNNNNKPLRQYDFIMKKRWIKTRSRVTNPIINYIYILQRSEFYTLIDNFTRNEVFNIIFTNKLNPLSALCISFLCFTIVPKLTQPC